MTVNVTLIVCFGSKFAAHLLKHCLLLETVFSQSILFRHCHLLFFDVPRHFAHEAAILALQRVVLTLNISCLHNS